MFYIVQLLIIIWCIIEAILEKYVIQLKCDVVNYKFIDDKEHLWSWVLYFFQTLAFSIIYYYYTNNLDVLLLFPISMFLRLVFFSNILNILRNKPIFYLSDRGWDKKIKDVISGKGLFILSIISIIILNFLKQLL